MFIQTEATPNPSTLKFIPGLVVLENGSLDFRSPEESRVSPLAERLFAVEGVAGVFLSQDFIAITKSDDKEWFLLKPALLGVIMEHFTAGRPVIDESDAASQAASGSEGEGEAGRENHARQARSQGATSLPAGFSRTTPSCTTTVRAAPARLRMSATAWLTAMNRSGLRYFHPPEGTKSTRRCTASGIDSGAQQVWACEVCAAMRSGRT